MGLLDNQTQNAYYTGSDFGAYQFTTMDNIINAFMVSYVGESKLITKVNRTDVQFHAMRAIQELSYDVLRSFKSQEIEVPSTLKMILPQDYVNYVKLARVDSNGIERILYPTGKTSNPFALTQNTDGTYEFGQQKRVSTVTFSSITDNENILNSKYITLGYRTEQDTQGFVSFRWHVNDWNTYSNPTGEGPIFGIEISAGETHISAATKLANEISNFGHHTVTQDLGVLTITYNDDMVNTTSVNSTEGSYQSSGAGLASNMVLANTNPGTAAGNNVIEQSPSNMWTNYQDQTDTDAYADDTSDLDVDLHGRRYGLDPQYSQSNGTFYIDYLRGYIHFGSTLAGETIVLKYVSDGLGTDSEMVVHKFCEEACYKWIAYGILSTRSNIPEYIVQRFKKEKFAETRKAKIRLSNIKIEEFTQVLKGMGKQIK